MTKKTVVIIGGTQEQTFKKIGKKLGCDVLFHNGLVRKGVKATFRPFVKKADCVVVLYGACGHGSQEAVKELCKELAVQVVFSRDRGASGAIALGLSAMELAV